MGSLVKNQRQVRGVALVKFSHFFPPSSARPPAPSVPVPTSEDRYQTQQSYSQATLQYQQRNLQLQQASTQLQAWGFGLIDLWRVTLWPTSGGPGTVVVMPSYYSEGSNGAVALLMEQYPGYTIGPIACAFRLMGY